MGRVDGKIVVITGAAGGQGAADAVALAREGATVIATDLHDEAPAVEASPGVTYRRLDVTRPADWSGLAAWLEREHGRVDGLVNNAGVPMRSRVEEVTLVDWDRVLAVNLTGPLLGIQALVPLMGTGGSIVNISSVAGLTGYHAAGYTVSKWGLRGLLRRQPGARPTGIPCQHDLPGFHRDPDDRERTRCLPDREHRRDRTRAHRAPSTRSRHWSCT